MQNINFILNDNISSQVEEYISKNNIFPIQQIKDYTSPFILIPHESNDHHIRLFINHDSSIPEGFFVFDFFDSGEIFLNTDILSKKISHAEINLRNLINLVFSSVPNPLMQYPDSDGLTVYLNGFFVEVFKQYRNDMYGWKLPIQGFFGSIPENIIDMKQKSPKVSPICKHYSLNDIVSKNYRFANIITDFDSCSSSKRINYETILHSCLFEPKKQSECPFYEPDVSILLTKEVKMHNSNNSEKFRLEHFHSRTGYNSFSIICGDNNVLNNIVTPPNISYDEALISAIEIFKKYLDCYTEASIVEIDLSEKESIEYKSLILTAVGQ